VVERPSTERKAVELARAHRRIETEPITDDNRIIFSVCIRVETAPKADRVALDVSTYDWVVVPIPVLVEPGLCRVVLAREAQVVGYGFVTTTRGKSSYGP
jgi:hypothetical protein